MTPTRKDYIQCAVLFVAFILGVAFATPLRVELVTSRGVLGDMTPVVTNTLISGETSEFYRSTITVSDYVLYDEARAGVDAFLDTTSTNAIFSILDHTDPFYARNVDFSSVSVWNSREGTKRAGVLIAPDKVLFVGHYHLYAGDVMRFVGRHNKVYNKEVEHVEAYADPSFETDLCVGWLTESLPIKPAPLLPDFWADGYQFSAPPCIGTDREGNWCVHEAQYLYAGTVGLKYPDSLYPYMDSHWGGESGSPVFIYFQSEWHLLGLFIGANKTLVRPQLWRIKELISRYEEVM